jgi:hypothetical protein
MTRSNRRIRNSNRIVNSALSMDFARLARANRSFKQAERHRAAKEQFKAEGKRMQSDFDAR